MTRKKLIAGNWKMNKTSADAVALARDIVAAVGTQPDVDVVICPPFTALEAVVRDDGSGLGQGVKLERARRRSARPRRLARRLPYAP